MINKHAGHCREHNLAVVSTIVHSAGTRKLVCNNQKSTLTESVITALSHTVINVHSTGTNKEV